MIRTLVFLAAIAIAAPVAAQTPTAFVAIRDLTVEGRDPPNYLRQTLDDNTIGVMRDFDVCYAGRQALRADLAGAIAFRMWVSSRQVIRVTPEADSVADPELLACVKSRLLAVTLPPDAPTAGATVRLRIVFTAPAAGHVVRCQDRTCSAVPCGGSGAPCCPADTCIGTGLVCLDAACSVPPPPPPPPPTFSLAISRVRGALTETEVNALVSSAAIAACTTEPLTREGLFALTFSRTGRVTVSTVRSARPTAASTCLRNALKALTAEARPRSTTARVSIAPAPTVAP